MQTSTPTGTSGPWKRLLSSPPVIESHRHRHEAVYRKGTAARAREGGLRLQVARRLPGRRDARSYSAGLPSVENPESAEELAHAQQRFNEMSKMHHASHLHPVPHSVHELLHQLALAAAFVFVFMTSTWSSAHADAHGGGEEEEEGGGGEGARTAARRRRSRTVLTTRRARSTRSRR